MGKRGGDGDGRGWRQMAGDGDGDGDSWVADGRIVNAYGIWDFCSVSSGIVDVLFPELAG